MRDVKGFSEAVSGARECCEFLESLAKGQVLFRPAGGKWSMLDSNEIFNHGLNTHRLMRDFIGTTEHAEDLERQLFECKRELRMLENKEIAPLVSARFAELKKSLLSDIENILDDYP